MDGPIPTLRFSTDDLSERDGAAMMGEVVGRSITHADFEPIRGVPLGYRCVARDLPGLGLTFLLLVASDLST
jgi:hypothetical protein